MTANLTVPADVWACQHPGVPLVAAIVEGTPIVEHPVHGDKMPGFYIEHPWGRIWQNWPDLDPGDSLPPAWLVALCDARCERCKGKGRLRQWQNEAGPGGGWATIPCDDGCVDGRLLHDVRVECSCPAIEYRKGGGWDCPTCGANEFGMDGYYTVRCLVDVVSVVDRETWWERHKGERSVIVNEAGEVFVFTPYPPSNAAPLGRNDQLTPAPVDALAAACGKPPADWVGMYAVVLTEVGE